MRTFTLKFLSVLLAIATINLVSVAMTSPAQADTVQHVYNTGGEGLWLHPDAPTLSGNLTDLMPDSTPFSISCWQYGDDVNGDSVWDYGTNLDSGNAGFAADFYLDTPVNQGTEGEQLVAMGIPQCGSPEVSSSTPEVATPPSDSGGGIDLQAYCDTLGWNAQVVLTAPKTPNDWGCLYQPLARPYLPGTVLAGSNALPPRVPNIVGAPVNFQEACIEQYGANTAAVLTDPNDVRSWRCYSLDNAGMS